MELYCPACKGDHEVPQEIEDDYGGQFIAPCGAELDVEYDETYDEGTNGEYSWWTMRVMHFCERCGAEHDDDKKPIICGTCTGERERNMWSRADLMKWPAKEA